MKIEAFQSGPIETNCYLIRFASGKAVLIDAAPESYKHAEVMKKKRKFHAYSRAAYSFAF